MKASDIDITDQGAEEPELTEKELAILISGMYTTPSDSNAMALSSLSGNSDWNVMSERLKDVNYNIMDGDLSIAEALLIDQAVVLQAIFSSCTSKMVNAEHLVQTEAYSKIALRAQNQCQRTLKTLLEYKNPKRTTFVKQQNNAVNQQINDGSLKEISEKESKSTNKLLEENHETRLDSGKTQEAVRVNSELETVGELNRTSHGTG